MKECLIVDGYNILHAWPQLAKLMAEDLEHARIRLVELLSNYGAFRGIKVIIIFDAHMVKGGQGSSETSCGVDIIYTQEGVTADMAIEKLVSRLPAGWQAIVATSDWTQQRIVFGKGAVRMAARELVAEVLSIDKEKDIYQDLRPVAEAGLGEHLPKETKDVLEKIRRSK